MMHIIIFLHLVLHNTSDSNRYVQLRSHGELFFLVLDSRYVVQSELIVMWCERVNAEMLVLVLLTINRIVSISDPNSLLLLKLTHKQQSSISFLIHRFRFFHPSHRITREFALSSGLEKLFTRCREKCLRSWSFETITKVISSVLRESSREPK